MTTIAYRSGVLAADTLIAYGSYTNGCRPKIERKGAYYVALAGLGWLRRPLEKWVEEGCDEEKVPKVLMDHDKEFSCLLIDDDGNSWTFDSGYIIPITAEYTAVGSGAMLALGAMAHGASAEEAVAAAAKHDKSTGGEITSFHFSTLN